MITIFLVAEHRNLRFTTCQMVAVICVCVFECKENGANDDAVDKFMVSSTIISAHFLYRPGCSAVKSSIGR